MKPTISSPGTGVQHLENFTRQFDRPSTTMPFSLLIFLGRFLPASALLAGAAGASAAFSAAAVLFMWSSSSRMRLTAFSAV